MTDTPIEVLITLPFDEEHLALLREISPRYNFTIQAARKADDISFETWTRTEVLYTDRVLPQPAQAPLLRWVQFHFAGIDFLADSPILRQANLTATTLSGANAPQLAEYALTMLLVLGHHVGDVINTQQKSEWPRDRWERFRPFELRGATIGLVGYGSGNRELARLLQPFGVTVLAAKRDVMHPQDTGYIQEGLGDPEGNLFHRLYPIQAIKSMLKECDFVVVILPLSPHTRGVIGAEELAAMKPGAYLVDCGRGGVVDQPALIQALQEHKIAGAALDVFSEEPLPASSLLWRMPNVIITPHVAGVSNHYMERAARMFAANLQRYLNGESLFNRYDVERGY